MRWLYRAIGQLLSLIVLASRRSCRARFGADPRTALREAGRPYVYAMLHAHQIATLLASDEPRLTAMVSSSRDAEFLRPILARFGVEAVLGSTRSASRDKGGQRALDTLSMRVAEGIPVLLAVDGPRGPRGRVHRGAADLARRTRAPVIPVVVIPSRRWVLRGTWDRFQIPKPLSTLRVEFGELVYASPGESADVLCDRISASLRELEGQHDPEESNHANGSRAPGGSRKD